LSYVLALKILFWGSLFVIFWTYFGYLIFMKLVTLFYTKKVVKQDYYPSVSLVVTAYNEEKRIARKIYNSLSVCYPRDKLDIIVVSDGSTDRTDEIVKSFESQGVRLLPMPTRQGKHHGQGKAVEAATGEIIVFSDATTYLKDDALIKITRNFADQEVGCVSGMDKIDSAQSGSAGEDAYVKYEMLLRKLESSTGNLIGVSGCFFAIRKSLCAKWYPNLSSDFYLPIMTRLAGFRVILEPEAVAYYIVLEDPGKEFHRKVRTVVNGMAVLEKHKKILNPFRYGVFSIQMLSHKIMRWWAPPGLVVIFVSNMMMLGLGSSYQILAVGQMALYVTALCALFLKPLRRFLIFKIPLFYVVVNFSVMVAWYKFLTGSRYVTWETTKR
jgi:cellulose synthase/poly-beta-1,6-N-acetylglucosamine synthase-like glycosyltransferase